MVLFEAQTTGTRAIGAMRGSAAACNALLASVARQPGKWEVEALRSKLRAG